MMIGDTRVHLERQPMATHNRDNFDAFATAGAPESSLRTASRRAALSFIRVPRDTLLDGTRYGM